MLMQCGSRMNLNMAFQGQEYSCKIQPEMKIILTFVEQKWDLLLLLNDMFLSTVGGIWKLRGLSLAAMSEPSSELS